MVAWWMRATPWLMAAVAALALYLGYIAYDLLQHRLEASSRRFDFTTRRADRDRAAYDAALDAALGLDAVLEAPAGPADAASLAAARERFGQASQALQQELADRGQVAEPALSAFVAAATRLKRAMEPLLGPPNQDLSARESARRQAQALLESLALLEAEVRRRQAQAEAFRAEVDDVRHHVLRAFAGIVAALVLVVAMAVQWGLTARREHAIRRRAERLAAVAENERARAEAVMRDKARFLGMLSHELLTPLQSLWSTMDLIEARGAVQSGEAAFSRLREGVRVLRCRISDLVDFAKISSGRLETRVRGFRLDELIDTVLRDLEEALAQRALDVVWEAPTDLREPIHSDPARLRQIVDNLLGNAVKYTERGSITLRAHVLGAPRRLRLEVSDTGAGIPAADLPRVFDPFFRSAATAAMAEGSGLGLAVVRSLVELMGGTIALASTPGQGTTVTVELPLTGTVSTAASTQPIARDLPVLVVDDSRHARHAMADLIRSMGIDVVEANGGRHGLELAARQDFRAILLDLQMPDLRGDRVARQLRKPGGRHERTLLVLVSASDDIDARSLDALVDARLAKPVARTELAAVLGCELR